MLISDTSFKDKFLFKGLFQFHEASMRCIHLPGQIYTSELTHAANATHLLAVRLEAFAVDNGGAGLVVLLLADYICWKLDSKARMESPIHTEYLRSGGAMIWGERRKQ